MKSSEIRKTFLDFFERKGHKIVPSSSLITDDPSVLFATAGMQQFKPYFLGEKSPYGDRVCSVQKCLRTSDIDKVGDESHLTFFEMLGNFSFGGYFKNETIAWAVEFLNSVGLENLWFTYFKGEGKIKEDREAKNVLQGLGIPEQRIFGFGKEENFWGPTGDKGPCGPTVEIHFDLTGKPCSEDCRPNCECGRFVELWNLVFNEYYRDEKGNLSALEQKGIDTGLGLERLAMALQKKINVFETDLFENSSDSRVISDHIKAAVFLISEGIMPEKIGRGYVLRRLLRKAGRMEGDLLEAARKTIEIYKGVYPELGRKEADILTVIQRESDSFGSSLEAGRKEYEKLKVLTGKAAFKLYATHSVPLEVSLGWAEADGKETKDMDDFYKLQEEHRNVSRAGAEKKFGGLGENAGEKAVKLHTATHLLHSALRQVLGEDVKQMGSDIDSERLRFDFAFGRKLTEGEIKEIEGLVNQKIKEDLKVEKEEMSLGKALDSGALAFFKEKYPDKVSVYSIGDFSKEICVGPHTQRTGDLGNFKILKEKSSGAGVRRIKAILDN